MISQTAPYVCRSKEGAIMCYRSIGCTGGFDGWQMHLDRHGGLATVLLSWLCCSGHLGLLVIYVQCTCMQIWIGRSRNSETVLQVVDLVRVRLPVHLCVPEAW